MISIAKVNNAKYHLEHSQFDYYTEQENEKGVFKGALMKWQNKDGKEVDEKTYLKQIDRGGKDNKGVDLCFSPPKDWTLIYNLADDDLRKKLDDIRDKAVNAVVKGIEQNTYYRETEDKETSYKLAKGVGMAVFNHHTSRDVEDEKINPDGMVDMQEHTHITVFPKVLGNGKQFYSHTLLDLKYESSNNHETLRYLDQKGQYELCKGLQELGFNVYEIDKHGNFGIEGITEELRNEFSKRKEQINDIAGENADYNRKKEVALKCRAKKDNHNLKELRSHWREKMEGMGFNKDKLNEMRNYDKPLNFENKKLEDLIDKDSPISDKKLKTLALSQSKFTKDVSFEDKLKEFKGNKNIKKLITNQNIYANTLERKKLCEKVAEKKKEIDKVKALKKDEYKIRSELKSDIRKKKKELFKEKGEANKLEWINGKLKETVEQIDLENKNRNEEKASKAKSSKSNSQNIDLNNTQFEPIKLLEKSGNDNVMVQLGDLPTANSKEELIGNIKNLEEQLLNVKIDGSEESKIKIFKLQEKIADLKDQLKKELERESRHNLNINTNIGNSNTNIEYKEEEQKKVKLPDEEDLIDEVAERLVAMDNRKIKETKLHIMLKEQFEEFRLKQELIKSKSIELGNLMIDVDVSDLSIEELNLDMKSLLSEMQSIKNSNQSKESNKDFEKQSDKDKNKDTELSIDLKTIDILSDDEKSKENNNDENKTLEETETKDNITIFKEMLAIQAQAQTQMER